MAAVPGARLRLCLTQDMTAVRRIRVDGGCGGLNHRRYLDIGKWSGSPISLHKVFEGPSPPKTHDAILIWRGLASSFFGRLTVRMPSL